MKFFEEEEINRKNYTKMSKKEKKPKKIISHIVLRWNIIQRK
jgi:hypothetical protein